MNYFHVFGKGRKGSHPDCQPASQSGGRGVSGGERGLGHFFKSFPLSASIQSSCTLELCKSTNFRRLVVLLLQNERERERDRSPIFGD